MYTAWVHKYHHCDREDFYHTKNHSLKYGGPKPLFIYFCQHYSAFSRIFSKLSYKAYILLCKHKNDLYATKRAIYIYVFACGSLFFLFYWLIVYSCIDNPYFIDLITVFLWAVYRSVVLQIVLSLYKPLHGLFPFPWQIL